MTRYEECLRRVREYVRGLRAAKTNETAIEGLVRSFVSQPAYDVMFREDLIRDTLNP